MSTPAAYSGSFGASFSVVICNYNYGAFVGEAIASALAQNYPQDRFEVIVVDDGSSDDSRAVIAAFAGHPQVIAVLQENRGQSAAFQAGVRVARGDYVCLLDSDDLFSPDKLARVARRIDALNADQADGGDASGNDPANLMLCHDLAIVNNGPGGSVAETWFDIVGISSLPDCLTLAQAANSFPFSVPCGLVFARELIASCLEALPTWEFPRGTDGILCPQALLKAGRVHYLRERLGSYRVHGGNELAQVIDGRFVPRIDCRARAPKSLRFLELWLDALDQPAAQRAIGFAYLRRAERIGRRLSASRGLAEPLVSIVVLGGDDEARARSLAAASAQSHGRVSVSALPAGDAAPAASELTLLASAYAQSDGEYLVFVRAGERIDREYVERHLHWRQHGALVGVSCCDLRLESAQGSLVHSDVFRASGAWKQAVQQIPPLATTLRDWVAPPLSACMFRRNAFLDRFFARGEALPEPLQRAGWWLMFHLQHHTSGVLRFCDTLLTCRLADGAAASYGYFSAAQGADGIIDELPVAEAVAWLSEFYCQENALFRRWLPPLWHQRFIAWLAQQQP